MQKTISGRHYLNYHKTSIFQTCSISQRPEVACRSQCCRCISLIKNRIERFKTKQDKNWEVKPSLYRQPTCMYISSIVPPFPVGIALKTSMLRQSRNHDGRSLRISATCNEFYHTLYTSKAAYDYWEINVREKEGGGGKGTSSAGRKNTFVGSRLTRPQARAATPLQLRETATIPIESGPGYILSLEMLYFWIGGTFMQSNAYMHINSLHISEERFKRPYLHPNHLDPVDSSSSSLGKELCQGLLSNCEKTKAQIKKVKPKQISGF